MRKKTHDSVSEWLRPVVGGDIIADSRQRESKAGVTPVSPLRAGGGGGQGTNTQHDSSLTSNTAKQNRAAASPSAYYFSLL